MKKKIAEKKAVALVNMCNIRENKAEILCQNL